MSSWKGTMYRATTILRRSRQASTIWSSPTASPPEQCSYVAPWRWIGYSDTPKLGISTLKQIKATDQSCHAISVTKISTPHLSADVNSCWLTSKCRYNTLRGFSGVPSLCRMYSSSTRTEPQVPKSPISSVSSSGVSEIGATDDGKNAKELIDTIRFHAQELFGNHQALEKVVVPLGGTLIGTTMAWFVMPIALRKLHKYASKGPLMKIWGDSNKKDLSYQTSLWSAMEDPAKYIITFMAFSQMAAVIEPNISAYLPQAWKGAFVVSFVWFLHRWKTNFIANSLSKETAIGIDRERLSAFDKVSSLGLIGLGVIALAEAFGVPVQSILTVGGVGGVATAFAARDILGNMLSGLSLQFSKPFSVGDYIKAGSIEGQVVEIGLTSTSLINTEKLPVVVPNSLFSSQVIMNKSRAMWHVSVAKLPVRTGDIEKIPAVTEEIKAELMSNPKIDAPYCYLSQLGSSQGELTVGCNIRGTKREEWSSTEQDILLKAAGVLKKHQLWSTV
ncbi:hypothetical protein QOZ80_2BG0196560 [Eleusine coracana subsp. coracana]|nr:hypothetical protein QOZ80_2BG0196560 [Eleusine coracana subsp. coracana]